MNPCNWCAAKKINGKQCTILWHVYDINIFHKDTKVIDGIIELFQDKCGNEAPLDITIEKLNE